MKRIVIAAFAAVVGLGMLVTDAEAKRLGGGSSSGMSRNSSVMQRQATPPAAAPRPAAAPTPAPAAAPAAAKPANRWLGPLAGLAAGVGIGALLGGAFGGGGMGGGMGGILSMLLMGLAAFFVIRMVMGMMNKNKPQDRPMEYAGGPAPAWEPAPAQPAAGTGYNVPIGGALAGGAAALAEPAAGPSIPADFDVPGFLRQAKLNFVRLQAANDAGNMDDIRECTTPEMYAEIKLELQERGGVPQKTEVVSVDAQLLDVTTEEKRHIASVRYTGLIRETPNAQPEAFDEVWHLTKPLDGSHGWTIAGIQQMQ